MERAIKQIEEDLAKFSRGEIPLPLRKGLKEEVDLRAARLIILSLQSASVGYQSALRLAGAKLGQGNGFRFETTELPLILEELKKIFEGLKWGRVEIKTDPKEKKASLRIIDSLTSAGIPNIEQTLCFFEEGFIEGCLDGVIRNRRVLTLFGLEGRIANIGVRETKCVGQGDDFCEFTITLGS